MRAVIQRVTQASVSIDGQEKAKINHGLLVLLGIEEQDNQEDIDWLCRKIAQLRIFDDLEGVMNLSIQDIEGEIMVISQFTLHAKVKKGNRPSYVDAAPPEIAIPLYEKFINDVTRAALRVERSVMENLAVDLYDEYFAGEQSVHISELPSCKVLLSFRYVCCQYSINDNS